MNNVDKSIKHPKDSKHSKESKHSKDSKESKGSKESKSSKDSKDSKDSKTIVEDARQPAEKPISLRPLKFEEAVGDLLRVKPDGKKSRLKSNVAVNAAQYRESN